MNLLHNSSKNIYFLSSEIIILFYSWKPWRRQRMLPMPLLEARRPVWWTLLQSSSRKGKFYGPGWRLRERHGWLHKLHSLLSMFFFYTKIVVYAIKHDKFNYVLKIVVVSLICNKLLKFRNLRVCGISNFSRIKAVLNLIGNCVL